MRRLITATFFALALAAPLIAAGVSADQGRGRDKPTGLPGLASAASSGVGETAEQKKRRTEYKRAGAEKLKAIVAKKPMTPEMKALVQRHWRIVMRLLRVQRIAENANKPAVAKRAADALAKEDARFYAKLDELTKAAPAPSASGGAK